MKGGGQTDRSQRAASVESGIAHGRQSFGKDGAFKKRTISEHAVSKDAQPRRESDVDKVGIAEHIVAECGERAVCRKLDFGKSGVGEYFVAECAHACGKRDGGDGGIVECTVIDDQLFALRREGDRFQAHAVGESVCADALQGGGQGDLCQADIFGECLVCDLRGAVGDGIFRILTGGQVVDEGRLILGEEHAVNGGVVGIAFADRKVCEFLASEHGGIERGERGGQAQGDELIAVEEGAFADRCDAVGELHIDKEAASRERACADLFADAVCGERDRRELFAVCKGVCTDALCAGIHFHSPFLCGRAVDEFFEVARVENAVLGGIECVALRDGYRVESVAVIVGGGEHACSVRKSGDGRAARGEIAEPLGKVHAEQRLAAAESARADGEHAFVALFKGDGGKTAFEERFIADRNDVGIFDACGDGDGAERGSISECALADGRKIALREAAVRVLIAERDCLDLRIAVERALSDDSEPAGEMDFRDQGLVEHIPRIVAVSRAEGEGRGAFLKGDGSEFAAVIESVCADRCDRGGNVEGGDLRFAERICADRLQRGTFFKGDGGEIPGVIASFKGMIADRFDRRRDGEFERFARLVERIVADGHRTAQIESGKAFVVIGFVAVIADFRKGICADRDRTVGKSERMQTRGPEGVVADCEGLIACSAERDRC